MFDKRKGQGYIEVMVVVAVLLIITLFAIPRYQDLRRDAYRAQIANDSKLVETYTIEHYFYEGDMPIGSKVISDSELKELVDSKRSYLKGDIISSNDIDAIGGKKHILDKEEVLKHVNTKLKGDFIYTDNGVIYVDNAKANNDIEKPGESKPKPEPVDQTDLIKKIEDDIENLANTDDKDEGYELMDSIPKEIKEIIDKDEQGKLNKNYEEALEIFLSKFLGPVKQVAGGPHSAVITEDGSLYTWGYNSRGQLGHGDTKNRAIPTKVTGISNVKQVSLGLFNSAAITEEGSLYTWGSGDDGQLGHGDPNNRNIPTKVAGISNVKQVALGSSHSAAITEDGSLYTWGWGDEGQLGHRDTESKSTPTKVNRLSNVKHVALGAAHSAAITENGDLYTWGNGKFGQLGHGNLGPGYRNDRTIPTKVTGISNVKQVALGNAHSAAITEDGSLYTWGGNSSSGRLGHGDTENKTVPTKVTGISNVKQVALGAVHSAAITENGSLYTWGNNSKGQLGHGDTNDRNIPTKVKGLSNIKQVSLGDSHSAAIIEDGSLYTWGNGRSGELGLGDTKDRNIPTKVDKKSNTK